MARLNSLYYIPSLLMPMLALLLAASLLPQTPSPTPERPRRILLDVDPGIDDALAMLLAMQSRELRIEAITVVSGNVIVDLGAENGGEVRLGSFSRVIMATRRARLALGITTVADGFEF